MDDSSDWEVLSAEYYDGGSEISASPSYISDEEGGEGGSDDSPQVRQRLSQEAHFPKISEPLDGILEGAMVEVGFHTPRKFSRNFEEVHGDANSSVQHSKRRERREREEKDKENLLSSSSSHPISPRVSILQRSGSFDGQSAAYLSDDSKPYLTPGLGEGEEDNFSDFSSSDIEVGARPRSNALQEKSEDGVPRVLNRYTQKSLGSGSTSKEMEAQKFKRGGSAAMRGERTGGTGGAGSGLSSSLILWKSSQMAATQSPSGSQ